MLRKKRGYQTIEASRFQQRLPGSYKICGIKPLKRPRFPIRPADAIFLKPERYFPRKTGVSIDGVEGVFHEIAFQLYHCLNIIRMKVRPPLSTCRYSPTSFIGEHDPAAGRKCSPGPVGTVERGINSMSLLPFANVS